jgi:transposase
MTNDAVTPSSKDPGDEFSRRDREELEALRRSAESLISGGNTQEAVDVLLGVISSLKSDNHRLVHRLAQSHRALYGRRSEKLTAEELGQLILALGGTEEEAANSEPNVPAPTRAAELGKSGDATRSSSTRRRRKTKHKGRTRLDPELPRVVTEVAVPADERACMHCGEEMQRIDAVDHEIVEFIPARIEVHVERREKLACKACKQDITTAARKAPMYVRRAGHSLLAHLVESKCDDALPVYRQRDQLRRAGFDAPLNTLYDYWTEAAQLLFPIAEAIHSTVLSEDIVGVDDTKLDYLDPAHPRGRQRGHLWCFMGLEPLVAFGFTETWCAEDVAPWLMAIDGFVQCDDYKGYDSRIRGPDGRDIVLVPTERRLGCMMHVRRRFHRAFKARHLGAALPIKLIKDLYAIEAEAREDGSDAEARLALRTKKSLPLLEQFDEWVDTELPNLRPTSPLGSAARYAKNQREFVARCFTDGRFEIDNGRVEREIREPAIGRKNFLFAGSADAARRLAGAYTVVLSARHTGLPVRDYLIDVMRKIDGGWPARRLTDLIPTRWGAERGILRP